MRKAPLRFSLLLAGLVLPVVASAGNITLTSAGGLAFGDGASVTVQGDGSRLADNGHSRKVCKADQVAVAATVPVTVVTAGGGHTYADGLVACYDLAQFNGAVAVSMEARITLRPAQ